MNDRSCSEAFKKVEEFRVLRNKSQERVDALEKEIAKLTSAMVDIDLAKHEMSEQVKEKEHKLQSSEEMVAKQVAEIDALKAKISALEKVILLSNSHLSQVFVVSLNFLTVSFVTAEYYR